MCVSGCVCLGVGVGVCQHVFVFPDTMRDKYRLLKNEVACRPTKPDIFQEVMAIFQNTGGSENSSVSKFVRHFVNKEQAERLGGRVNPAKALWVDEKFLPMGGYISVCFNMRKTGVRMGVAPSAKTMYNVDGPTKQKSAPKTLLKIDSTTCEDDLLQLLLPDYVDCGLRDSVHIMITMPDDELTCDGKSLDDSSLIMEELREEAHMTRCAKAGKDAAVEASAQRKLGVVLCKAFDKTQSKKQKATNKKRRIEEDIAPSLNAKSRATPEQQIMMARLAPEEFKTYLVKVAQFASRRCTSRSAPTSKLMLYGECVSRNDPFCVFVRLLMRVCVVCIFVLNSTTTHIQTAKGVQCLALALLRKSAKPKSSMYLRRETRPRPIGLPRTNSSRGVRGPRLRDRVSRRAFPCRLRRHTACMLFSAIRVYVYAILYDCRQ